MRYSGIILSFAVILCWGFIGCGSNPGYPDDVNQALKEAGNNRAELEKVIEHYMTAGDSLKLEAAYFLIGNMSEHGYATYKLVDSTGQTHEFDPSIYPNYDTLMLALDSIEQQVGEIDFEKDIFDDDLEIITADFLIENIDYAFKAWREKPWARELSFDTFCEYILPYRGSNEPLERWREVFWEKYADLEDQLKDPTDPIEAAAKINDDIKTWFGFDPRWYLHPTDQGLSEMLEGGLGRCEDMTNITIYAMRAMGLGVTSDYTPAWANSGNNHAWNSIVTADGRVIPFMGAEASPGSYKLHNKAAKVYRKSFAKKKSNLIFTDHKQEELPGWLRGKSYVDVTADYFEVCDVTVKLTAEIPDSVDIAYICVFNSGEWRALHWGKIDGNNVTFTEMGKNIAYLPAFYINEEIVGAGEPFLLGDDCSVIYLKSNIDNKMDAALISTTKREQAESTDGIGKAFFKDGTSYELFYWADGWQSLGEQIAENEPLLFKDVPSNSLFWLVEKDSDKEERIFTLKDGRQVWW